MYQDLLTGFREYIEREQLFSRGEKILLAVSGGADSVVMAHLFHAAGLSFAIAHCNFQLRGRESERDEQFVDRLGAAYNVPVHKIRFDTAAYVATHRVSIQVAARELRYEWLEDTRNIHGYTFIATAHHMQDNVETVLMNFCKGTGLAGLHGILPRQGFIVRPLLFAQKEEILAYAEKHTLAFVEDSSNITDKYTRNFFRHRVLPPIQEAYPGAVQHMAGTIARVREAELLYQEAVVRHRKRLLEQKGTTFMVPVLKLQKTRPLHTISYELFKSFGVTPAQVSQVLDLLQSESGRYVATPSHRIIRNRQWLLITPQAPQEADFLAIEKEQRHVHIPGAHLKLRLQEKDTLGTIPSAAHIACLDSKHIRYPLVLRRWKQGDYFYPLGMDKKKKLSRFFIDQKLSLPQKEQLWVLESAKRIVWIVGMRIDDRFKITEGTREILYLEMIPDKE
ncbi:tRNA lysidine(34) synthetase TilS [uncultured Chitinophaga sp.]|mgnify:CR=1 FL=1|jgi:tRNA(Ile)-lysidine synthetase, N-terminal domain/tRNA(Ile)-lysidine synthetase, C-terminal domain|uniref:tRNA lysidine(34) synthetase TilS n=1 Tax=uncultured Chitinophaga sp. TaxID=339340 RepID=UPI0026113338|nr:tRNA lysidine(34) synthetase TilS [uncultured Chitinophaga sp.]